MTWGKLDDKLHSHPKVQGLSENDTERLAAIGLWTLVLSHGCDYLLDGRIDRSVVVRLAGSAKLADRLVTHLVRCGLWDERDGGGWSFHDWHQYQPSKEEVEALKAKRAEAGRNGGKLSGKQRRSKREANPKQVLQKNEANTKQDPKPNEANLNPVPVPVPIQTKDKHLSALPTGNGGEKPSGELGEVWANWLTCRALVFEKGEPVWSEKRKNMLRARRREGLGVETLKRAAVGIWGDPWNLEDPDRRISFEICYRDAGQVERYAAKAEDAPAPMVVARAPADFQSKPPQLPGLESTG